MALGLLHAFRDCGLEVPGDVSVVGFDDIPEAAHFWPPLTTVRQDFEELGRRCVARLLSGKDEEEPRPLEPMLVVRDSTAGPAHSTPMTISQDTPEVFFSPARSGLVDCA